MQRSHAPDCFVLSVQFITTTLGERRKTLKGNAREQRRADGDHFVVEVEGRVVNRDLVRFVANTQANHRPRNLALIFGKVYEF